MGMPKNSLGAEQIQCPALGLVGNCLLLTDRAGDPAELKRSFRQLSCIWRFWVYRIQTRRPGCLINKSFERTPFSRNALTGVAWKPRTETRGQRDRKGQLKRL